MLVAKNAIGLEAVADLEALHAVDERRPRSVQASGTVPARSAGRSPKRDELDATDIQPL